MLARRAMALALLLVLVRCGVEREAPSLRPRHARHAIVNGEPCGAADSVCFGTGAILTRGFVDESERAGMTCSGVLIAPDAVLTAGHCTEIELSFYSGQGHDIDNFFSLADDVRAFGRSTSEPPPPFDRIVHLVAHPDYDRANFALYPVGLARLADIGIAFLAEGLDEVPLAVLPGGPVGEVLAPGLAVDIVGYGRTAASSSDGVRLQARSLVNEVNATELQVGDALPTPVTCLGDSGGPTLGELGDGLLPRRRLLGVTSRAYDQSVCEVGGVATRTDAFRDWVDGTLRAACADGLRPAGRCTDGGGLARPVLPTALDAGDPVLDDEALGCDCRAARAGPAPCALAMLAGAWGILRRRRR